MKRAGVLNAQLARVLAALGHRDEVAIVDCGMPVPSGVEIVDLALVQGVPPFSAVLDAVADELVVEGIVRAAETAERNPELLARLDARFPELPVEVISHDDLKRRLGRVRAVVRSGEATPYANVVLVCGVAF